MESNMNTRENEPKSSSGRRNAAIIGGSLLTVIAVVGIFYLFMTSNQIYTDKADLESPNISISSQGGVLQKMLVKEGDVVEANTPVAQVADQILTTTQGGVVISAENNEGKVLNPGEPVVTLINPAELKVIAHVDEDKGLSQIKVGQVVSFTVDAFGSKKFSGIVDSISSTSRQSGVVFNISDQREVKQFDVKIRFDVKKYPELKNGMSAKVTIFKN